MGAGVWLELGGGRGRARARGGSGSAADPGGMLPRGLLRFPPLRLLPEPPAKPEGTGSDRREEISRAVSWGAGLAHGGLRHPPAPWPGPGVPSGRRWRLVPRRGGADLGGSRAAARLPFPSAGNPSPQPESRWEEERGCKQTSFHRPPRRAGSRSAAAARLRACRLSPRDSGVPTGGRCPLGDRDKVWGRMWGRDVPGGSLGELPGIRGSCEKRLATAGEVL